VAQVALEQDAGRTAQRRLHGGDLGEDVRAVALLVDHPLQPAHLAFDALQPIDQLPPVPVAEAEPLVRMALRSGVTVASRNFVPILTGLLYHTPLPY
jgi:hypothetical protein